VVFFTFATAPPSNVTNMFGNWLNRVDKKSTAQIRVETCALVWSLWNCVNDVIFNKNNNVNFFIAYPQRYSLDPQMILSSARGATSSYEFFVFLSGDDCTSYLQSG
jgi:hypothetical protein